MRALHALCGLFFLSGLCTLLYQVAWQRALLNVVGVQSTSIAIVVSAFLAGLGVGSTLGARLSRIATMSPLHLFWTFEATIGLFGIVSLDILDRIEALCTGLTPMQTGAVAFGFVLGPTVLMGATLPLLTAHAVTNIGNSARASVARLYAVNTYGASAGCLLAALWALATLGLDGTVRLAAAINGIVAIGALALVSRTERKTSPAGEPTPRTPPLPLAATIGVAALIGGVSLGYEIVWARLYDFFTGSHPATFPILLAVLLAGTGAGAWGAHRATPSELGLRTLGWRVLAGCTIGSAIVPILALAPELDGTPHPISWLAITLLLGGFSFMAFGACLPQLVDLCVRTRAQAGPRVGALYAANLAGAVTAPLCIGLWALDHLSSATVNSALLTLGCLAALVLFTYDARHRSRRTPKAELAGVTLGLAGAVVLALSLADSLYPKLIAQKHPGFSRETRVIESAQGIIVATKDGTVFGNGMYDGMAHIDPAGDDRNDIVRPFLLSAFHRAPRRILMIGLGSGAWAQVLAHHPDAQSLTIVDIHPGYRTIIAEHDATRSLLSNPKVRIVTDDARRWLRHHPEEQFDAIVANITFHWRTYTSSLLSFEMLSLVRSRLAPGGIYLYNITGSNVAARTAALDAGAHQVGRIGETIVTAKTPNDLVPDITHLEHILSTYRIDGTPVFDLAQDAHRRRIDTILALLEPDTGRWKTRKAILSETAGLDTVTDRNLRTEWPRSRDTPPP